MYKRADRQVVNEWGTLAFILLFVTNSVSRFVANVWIGRKNVFFLCGRNLRAEKST